MSPLRVPKIFILLCLLLANVAPTNAAPNYPGVESLEKCQGPHAPAAYGADFCGLASYVQENTIPLPPLASILFNPPVVLLGDTHPNKLLKRWLIENLAAFKANGFTHVGLEFLNSESQDLVNEYRKNPSLKNQVLQLIQKDWGWIPEEHLAVIDAIHNSGLELVALDNRNELAKKNLSEEKTIELRNRHMAQVIQDSLNQPFAGRMVVLTGKVHSALISDDPNTRTLPQVLAEKNIPTRSLDLESGELAVPRKVTQALQQSLERHLLPTSPEGQYYLPTPPQSPTDGIIFILK